jgi:hypothetical protein
MFGFKLLPSTEKPVLSYVPKYKRGAFIEFMMNDSDIEYKGEVYKVDINRETRKFEYEVLISNGGEFQGFPWVVQENEILREITEQEYKTGFTPNAGFSEFRAQLMKEFSFDGRGRSRIRKGVKSIKVKGRKGVKSITGKSRKGVNKSSDKKKKSPSRYNLFVKKNFDKCGGDFKKIAEMWKKHKNDE